MNQILDFGADGSGNNFNDNNFNNGFNNDFNNNNKKQKPEKVKEPKVKEPKIKEPKIKEPKEKKESSSMGGKLKLDGSDKVVRVFAILLIALAAFLIFSGVTSLKDNKKTEKESSKPVETKSDLEATITAVLNEETGKIVITAESKSPISELRCYWDDQTEKTFAGERQTNMTAEVDIIAGEHTLTVQLKDVEDKTKTESFQFASETGIDTERPDITLESEGNMLIITATDETSLASLTYMWDEGEQVVVQADENNPRKIEVSVEIPKGTHTISVIAVDENEIPNVKTATRTFEGHMKPVIEYLFPNGDESVLQVTVSHEDGIKMIYYTLNGQPFQYEVPEGEVQTSLTFTQESVVGENSLNLIVTSVDDVQETWNPVWTYYPPESETTTEEQTDNQTSEDNNTANSTAQN